MATEQFLHQLDELQRAFVVHVIVNTIGVFFAREDALFPKYPKMLRDVALRRADLLHDILHADLIGSEEAKYFQPERVGHRFQALRRPDDVVFCRDEAIRRITQGSRPAANHLHEAIYAPERDGRPKRR